MEAVKEKKKIFNKNSIGPLRPWGRYEIFFESETCKVKRIIVKPQQRLSYKYHNKRKETWVVVEGVARVTIEGKEEDYNIGDVITINPEQKHRIGNPSDSKEMTIIEVQTGTYFGEDDSVRIEDDYERV